MSDCSLINVWGFFCLFVLLFGLLAGGGWGGVVCVCQKTLPKESRKSGQGFCLVVFIGSQHLAPEFDFRKKILPGSATISRKNY